jgi:hypothetical protein
MGFNRRKLGFDNAQPWAGTLTQRHARLIGTENRRVESCGPGHLRGWGAVEGAGATGNAKHNAARLFGKQAAVTVVP